MPKASSAVRVRRPKVAFLYTGQGSQYVNMLKAAPSDGADSG